MSKDVDFARNLAKQMEEGYGRHNSNLSFRHAGISLGCVLYPVVEINNARIIGRAGDKAIRERWQDCSIGDVVPEELFEPQLVGQNFVEIVVATSVTGNLMFERVGVEMIDAHNDREVEYFWKRLS